MRRIQDKKHKMGTCKINKISSSCLDDKRFVLNENRFSQMITNKKDSKRFSQMVTTKNECI